MLTVYFIESLTKRFVCY